MPSSVRAEQVAVVWGVAVGLAALFEALDGGNVAVPEAAAVPVAVLADDAPGGTDELTLADGFVGPEEVPHDAASTAASAAIRQVPTIGTLSNRRTRAVWGIAKE
jgi:hypothetical protein